MSMTEWARHEIELAIKFDDSDYGRSCYLSALKAYESLMADNHSGLSFSLTKNILDRLTNSLPLTPINDIPEEWEDVSIENRWPKRYQHKRHYSLFKHVEEDGTIDIFDMDRWKCVESSNPERGLGTIRIVQRVMDDIYPIKFPYTPESSKIVIINLLRDDDDKLTHVCIMGYRDNDYKQRIINKKLRYNKETGNWEELETGKTGTEVVRIW